MPELTPDELVQAVFDYAVANRGTGDQPDDPLAQLQLSTSSRLKLMALRALVQSAGSPEEGDGGAETKGKTWGRPIAALGKTWGRPLVPPEGEEAGKTWGRPFAPPDDAHTGKTWGRPLVPPDGESQ